MIELGENFFLCRQFLLKTFAVKRLYLLKVKDVLIKTTKFVLKGIDVTLEVIKDIHDSFLKQTEKQNG